MTNESVALNSIKKTLLIMPLIIFVMFIAVFIEITVYKYQEFTLQGKEYSNQVGMMIDGRSDSTSSWVKRNFQLEDRVVDLKAKTIDGTFTNDSIIDVKNWTLRVDIKEDCFLNNAWCGTVEIHQNVLTDEKVQTLNLRNYVLDEVYLKHYFDGDLLIPLTEGDYFIYYPSEPEGETVIAKEAQITIGFIMYFFGAEDVFDYTVTFHFDKHIQDSGLFYIGVIFVIAWLLLLIAYIDSYLTRKSAAKEMENKISGMRCMSEIYAIIYLIDMETDEIIPVSVDPDADKTRPKNLPASEQVKNLFMVDSVESFKEATCNFCDFDNLRKLMEDKDTCAFEYLSANYGWSRIRFFAVDRKPGRPLRKILFTVQEINEEKEEFERAKKLANAVEQDSAAREVFLTRISGEIISPVNSILEYNAKILEKTNEPAVRAHAEEMDKTANMLLQQMNRIIEKSKSYIRSETK